VKRASLVLRQPVFWILLLAFFHGAWYAAIVHPWQAPDEYLHYQQLRLLDARRSMMITAQDMSSTVQWEVADTMWLFEHHRYRLLPTPLESVYHGIRMPLGYTGGYSNQAPLYYLLSLPIYWATSSWPVVAQLYVLRLFSVILHVATVWLTYKLARLIFQGPRFQRQVSQTIALSSAGVVALLPQYTFISASFNNDNMTSPLVAATLFAMFKSVQEQGRLRWLLLASILAILAITAKRTAIGIVPLMGLVVIACGLLWWRSGRPVLRVAGALIVALPVVGLAGLMLLLTNPMPIPAELAGVFRVTTGALLQLTGYLNDPIQLMNRLDWNSWSRYVLESFWGQFAWLTIRLDPFVIDATEWVTKFLMIGCILGALRAFRSWRSPGSGLRAFGLSTMALGLLVTGLVMAAQYMVDSFVAPQGRYLFPFISAFGILAVWGWRSWWPGKWQDPATLLGLGLLVLLDIISSATIISYFYS
jgi:4-amino-4-deoxy-L-arabinose transferase-like glycosyltransferase